MEDVKNLINLFNKRTLIVTALFTIISIPGSLSSQTEFYKKQFPELVSIANRKEISGKKIVNEGLIKAIIKVESENNPNALSKKGARGLMQLMPKTWEVFGEGDFQNAFNPEKNIKAGEEYPKWIKNYCKEKHPKWKSLKLDKQRNLIVAAYNGGGARLSYRGWEIEKMPKETRNYVKKINNAME